MVETAVFVRGLSIGVSTFTGFFWAISRPPARPMVDLCWYLMMISRAEVC